MSNSRRLQDTIQAAICKQLPPLRKTREQNLARFCAALYQAEHVHLPKIADHCPGRAQQTSKTRRLRRFLSNDAVAPRAFYRPVAQSLIQAAAQGGPVRLLIDTLHLTGNRRLLVAAVAFRRRALPVLWRVDDASGVTGQDLQRTFVQALQPLVPEDAEVVVIGDGEFHGVSLLKAVEAAGWTYCVRLHADTFLRDGPPTSSSPRTDADRAPRTWTYCRDLDPEPGHRRDLYPVQITKEHAFGPARVVYYWARGEERPWRLVTNAPPAEGPVACAREILQHYRRRMWIEELFGDWEGGRFQLHRTRLHAPARIARLVLVLSLVYVWLVAVGSAVVKRGDRFYVDRTDRRDRSYLAIGLRWIRRCLQNDAPIPWRWTPYF
jgi:hypothetical protein